MAAPANYVLPDMKLGMKFGMKFDMNLTDIYGSTRWQYAKRPDEPGVIPFTLHFYY